MAFSWWRWNRKKALSPPMSRTQRCSGAGRAGTPTCGQDVAGPEAGGEIAELAGAVEGLWLAQGR